MRGMAESLKPIPFTVWEVVVWASLGSAAALNLAFASGTEEVIIAAGWVIGFLLFVMWVIRAHRHRPEVFANPVPFEILWLIALVGLGFAISVVAADQLSTKLVNGALAISALATILNERKRVIPPRQPQRLDREGYLGRLVSDRALRIAVWATGLIAVSYCIVAYLVAPPDYLLAMSTLIPVAAFAYLLAELHNRRDRRADPKRLASW
jgi:hypothetical protein